MFNYNTPIEEYTVGKKTVYVKRDDMFGQPPAPALAKLRGITKYVEKAEQKGIKILGDLDTRVSKSGWGLACACQNTSITPYVFYPQLKAETQMPFIQTRALNLGAKVIPLKAGRTSVLYAQATRKIQKLGGTMLPMGLTLKETVDEVAKVINDTPRELLTGTIITTTGTSTIASGIVKGLIQNNIKPKQFYGVSCGMSNYKQAKVMERLLSEYYPVKIPRWVQFVLPEFEYYDASDIKVPFPCSPYYDRKGWIWLNRYIKHLKSPILFWNVGD